MSVRPVLALVLTAALAAGGAASAAPKKKPKPPAPPVCNLVVDATGDDGAVFPHSESLDLTGADIASDAKTVTAVLRVAKYTESDGNTAPTGRSWYLDFSVPTGEAPLWLGVQVTPTGTLFRYGWVDGSIHRSLGEVTGVIDAAKNELRVSAPTGIWADRGAVKPGSKLTGLVASSYNFVGVAAAGGSLQPGDTAESSKSYVAATPSCVAVGK